MSLILKSLFLLIALACFMQARAERALIRDSSISDAPLTVPVLRQYYGAKLVEDRYLCGLGTKAFLRQPAHWDCVVYRVRNVKWGDVPMDSVRYRTLPNGDVISVVWMREGDCNKALETLFSIKGHLFNGVSPAEFAGAQIRTDPIVAVGHIAFKKSFHGHELGARLDYEDAKCQISLYDDIEAAATP